MKRFVVKGEEFIVPENYTISRFIQAGAYGNVVEGMDSNHNIPVAIKKCNNILGDRIRGKDDDETTKNFLKRMLRETEILTFFSHKPNEHLVRLLEAYYYNTDIYLIFELMSCDLRDLMKSDSSISRKTVKILCYQILLGIILLHSRQIIHRDIKPRNILINVAEQTVKLCDLGLARQVGGSNYETENELNLMSTSNLATRWYRPPELLLGCRCVQEPIDLWAFGCILGELLRKGHRPLFPGRNRINQLTKIINILGGQKIADVFGCEKGKLWVQTFRNKAKKDFRNILFERNLRTMFHDEAEEMECGEEENAKDMKEREDLFQEEDLACDLLDKCLQFNIRKRISAEEAIRHDYFRDIFDEQDLIEMEHNLKRMERFETVCRQDMSCEELRRSIQNVILKFNPKSEEYEKLGIDSEEEGSNSVIG